MKYLKYLFIFLLFLQNPFLGTTQSSDHDSLTEKGINNNIYFLVKESFPENKKGKLFFNDKWIDGTITDYQNNQYILSIRYRVYKEEMQVKHAKKTKALQPQQVKKIEFGDDVFIASDFMLNEEKFMSFFEVVNEGKLQLLNQYESKEEKGVYSIQSNFYSKKEKNPAEKISFKKKNILKLMEDQKTEIQKFLKDKKINLKKSDDIIKLFEFYNSL